MTDPPSEKTEQVRGGVPSGKEILNMEKMPGHDPHVVSHGRIVRPYPLTRRKTGFVRHGVVLLVVESLGIGQGYGFTPQCQVSSLKTCTPNRYGKRGDIYVHTMILLMVQPYQRSVLNREEAFLCLSRHGSCLSIRAKKAPTRPLEAKFVHAMHAGDANNILER